jgi:hypothetical protein
MPKRLAFFFLIFYYFSRDCFAVINLEYSGIPVEITQEESFFIEIDLTGAAKNNTYYLKVGFQKEPGSGYFGYTKNHQQEWIKYGEPNDRFYKIETDSEGNWSDSIETKADVSQDSAFSGSGDYFVKISRSTASSDNWYSNDSKVKITVPQPTNTPTFIPTPTETPTPIPTEKKTNPTATYKINKSKNTEGEFLSSVKIYVDGSYTHHYDDEILKFCDNCFCDDGKEVDCGFGEHEIKLVKAGYHDWSETKLIQKEDYFEVNPEMAVIEPTVVPTNTPTTTPTPTTIPTPEATESADIVLASDSADFNDISFVVDSSNQTSDSGDILGDVSDKEATKSSMKKGKALAGGLIVIGGTAFILAGLFSGKNKLVSDRIEE